MATSFELCVVASLCVIGDPFRDGFAVAAGPGAAGDDGNPGHQNPFVGGPPELVSACTSNHILYLLRQASTPRHVPQPVGMAEIKPLTPAEEWAWRTLVRCWSSRSSWKPICLRFQ